MLDPDRGDPAATRQSRRGSALFEHAFEHGVWPARHREFVGEDHDRRRSRVYGDRVDVGSAGIHRIAFGVAIDTGGTGGEPQPDTNTGATSRARCITSDTRGFTSGESVISGLVFTSSTGRKLRI